MKRWITRRLPIALVAVAASLPLAAGVVMAQERGGPDVALTSLAEVEDSGYRGSTALVGSLQTGPERIDETHAITTLVPIGGGPLAPEPPSIGHAVLLSGTCEQPVRIVRDMGQLRPLSNESGFGNVGDDETAPAWAVVDTIPVSIQPLIQGVIVAAVLDDTFDEGVLDQEEILADEGFDENEIFNDAGLFNNEVLLDETALDPAVRGNLRERMLSCGVLNTEGLVGPGH